MSYGLFKRLIFVISPKLHIDNHGTLHFCVSCLKVFESIGHLLLGNFLVDWLSVGISLALNDGSYIAWLVILFLTFSVM
jgi:hypothetical protein